MEKKKVERTFHQKGAVIVMKEDVPDVELTPVDILNNISQLEKHIDQSKTNIKQSEETIEIENDNLVRLEESMKKIKKFESWAIDYQLAKLKVFVADSKDALIKKVDAEYKNDQALSPEQNGRQKFALLQKYIATSENFRKEISPSIYRKYIFEECVFDNPWK